MNYYFSDLHLFHKNVTKEGNNFDNRPFETLDEMHKTIQENWNSVVTNADHVYIAGDLSWKESDEAIALVSTLKGNKHLILGNHDTVKDQRYKQLFVEVTNYKEVKDTVNGRAYHVIVSHFPIAFWNYQRRQRDAGTEKEHWAVHLYGHLHNTCEELYFQEFVHKINNELGMKCIAKNVGCMMPYVNYTPVTLEQLLEH